MLSPILFYQCGCPSLCARRVVSRPRQMRRMLIRHLLFIPKFYRYIALQLFLLEPYVFTHSVSSTLSLYAFILAFPVKALSTAVLIRSLHSF